MAPIVVSGGTAYVGLGSQDLVAVALGDGAILWRRPDAGRPIAASAAHLLTYGMWGYDLRSTETGDSIAGLDDARLPHPEDIVDIRVGETPEGPTIAWTSLPRYRGGAVPPRSMAAPRPESDAIVVDVASGVATPVRAPAPTGGPAAPSVALSLSESTMILEARDPAGTTRWSTSLGEVTWSRPAPLPQ